MKLCTVIVRHISTKNQQFVKHCLYVWQGLQNLGGVIKDQQQIMKNFSLNLNFSSKKFKISKNAWSLISKNCTALVRFHRIVMTSRLIDKHQILYLGRVGNLIESEIFSWPKKWSVIHRHDQQLNEVGCTLLLSLLSALIHFGLWYSKKLFHKSLGLRLQVKYLTGNVVGKGGKNVLL